MSKKSGLMFIVYAHIYDINDWTKLLGHTVAMVEYPKIMFPMQ